MGNYRLYPESYEEKLPYFNEFIARYSDSNNKQIRNKLIYFALYLEEKYKINVIHPDSQYLSKTVLDFLTNDIDKRQISRIAKTKWRNNLNVYYNYIKEIKEKLEGIPFINPVPSINLLDFKEKETDMGDLESEEDLLTYQDVEKILNYLFFTSLRLFTITSILLYTGARISEVCRIELKKLDIEERYFITKVKSRKALNKFGIYFLPKFFISQLKEWIRIIMLENPGTKYLFPRNNHYISTNTIRKNLKKVRNELGLNCKMNPHAFRDLINSERFDTKMKAKYRFLLLNQTPPDVNVNHYIKKYKKRKELQKKYDEFFPFPEFIPNLNLM